MRKITMKKIAIILSLTALMVSSFTVQAAKDRFERWDKDSNGKVTEAEYTKRSKNKEKAAARFKRFDANDDGFITKDEEAKMPPPKAKK